MNAYQQWKYARLLEKENHFFCVRCVPRKLSLSCGKSKLGKTPQAKYELRRLDTC